MSSKRSERRIKNIKGIKSEISKKHRYTKRISLAAVYGATEVFMLQDR